MAAPSHQWLKIGKVASEGGLSVKTEGVRT